ncbi:ribosome maturation factor RimM [Oceanibaculum pacificum]|uniref:Ribosome maturation factor RimM n=1 Tax=Oceanibaculum pacificum TaxID=580166 RepID=A0A154W2Y1_9PROT|nr:ribosome maturation factor RimM [Oceanibaculum pacificum]KZD07914.1 16S rRNA-processing protein RimM [Oceanibaculum pacificum]
MRDTTGDAEGGGELLLGIVVGAQGIRGQLRIRSFTGEPDALFGYGPLLGRRRDGEEGRRLTLRRTGQAKDVVLAAVDGIADRTTAEGLKGLRLYIERSALPALEEDEYYHADLLGLAVELVGGGRLGTVKAVHDFGAGDMLEIADAAGRTKFVPFTRKAVPVVDLPAGRLVADPPEGILDDGRQGPGDQEGGDEDEPDYRVSDTRDGTE